MKAATIRKNEEKRFALSLLEEKTVSNGIKGWELYGIKPIK
jgi:hypothetical protein